MEITSICVQRKIQCKLLYLLSPRDPGNVDRLADTIVHYSGVQGLCDVLGSYEDIDSKNAANHNGVELEDQLRSRIQC